MNVIATADDLPKLAEKLAATDRIGLDFETTSYHTVDKAPLQFDLMKVVGWGFGFPDGEKVYLPIGHAAGINLDFLQARTLLRNVLTDKDKIVWAANAKFEAIVTNTLRIDHKCQWRCSMIAQWLLDRKLPGAGGYRLKPAVKHFLGHKMTDWDEVVPKNYRAHMVSPTSLGEYCADDSLQCLRLGEYFLEEIDELSLRKVFLDLEMPIATEVLPHMDETGFEIDREFLQNLYVEYSSEMQKLEDEFYSLCHVGISKNQAISKKMYDDLKFWPVLNHFERGKSGYYSIDKHHLAAIRPKLKEGSKGLKALELKLRYQTISKIANTYTLSLIKKADRYIDKRLRCDWLQHGTECMPAGELVLTNRGYLPVERVQVGDEVVTHKGRVKPVVAFMKNKPSPIVRVILSNKTMLRTTENHKYKTLEGWKRADELQVGDTVVVHTNGEQWKPIADWEDFEVSSFGRVRNKITGNVRKPWKKTKFGHLQVHLYRNGATSRHDGDRKNFSVHRLVCRAFHGEPSGNKTEVRHLNGIAWDNTADNLCWGTSAENAQDAVKHGTRGCSRKLSIEEVQFIRDTPVSIISNVEFSRRFGVHRSLIGRIRKGEVWKLLDPIDNTVAFSTSEVVAIRRESSEITYGLTVEDDHSHVTSGIVTHNTGRFASRNPNFQNIPIRIPEGRKIRGAFIHAEGWSLYDRDYSGADLRVFAHLSNEENMLDIFNSEEADLHQQTANECRCDRQAGKVANLGLIYEMGAKTLSNAVGCSETEGYRLHRAWHAAYPRVRRYHAKQHRYAEKYGYVRTITGRIRRLPDIHSKNSYKRYLAQHASSNTPSQGSVADIVKIAMRNLVRDWKGRGVLWNYYTKEGKARINSQVHDELIVELREDFKEEGAADVRRHMEEAVKLRCPLTTEGNFGESWLEAH